jgi:hypothetical protein
VTARQEKGDLVLKRNIGGEMEPLIWGGGILLHFYLIAISVNALVLL